jgi:pimeloyl-ACP methyl ester carboxylesterase
VAPIVSIPDAAHAMHRDNPAAFNTAVLDFLARH